MFSPDISSVPTFRKLESVLIDTGSDFTLIPNRVIQKLALKPSGDDVLLENFNGGLETVKLFPCRIKIEDILDEIFLVGETYSSAVIGMDVISKMDVLIQFSTGTFEMLKI